MFNCFKCGSTKAYSDSDTDLDGDFAMQGTTTVVETKVTNFQSVGYTEPPVPLSFVNHAAMDASSFELRLEAIAANDADKPELNSAGCDETEDKIEFSSDSDIELELSGIDFYSQDVLFSSMLKYTSPDEEMMDTDSDDSFEFVDEADHSNHTNHSNKKQKLD